MAPNAGRGLHSFESFSFVIIALIRFISYQGRRKGKVGSPGGKTWTTSNRRNKKHKRSENYSRTHRFRRYHVEPFESCWANIGWKANFTCGIPRGDYKNMLSWSYQRGSWGSGWNPFEDSTDKGGNRHRTCSGKKWRDVSVYFFFTWFGKNSSYRGTYSHQKPKSSSCAITT